MQADIIKISHLSKSFGDVKAVNDISFQVKKGELFAFLGFCPGSYGLFYGHLAC